MLELGPGQMGEVGERRLAGHSGDSGVRGARKEVEEQGRPKGPWGGAADRVVGSCALLRGTSKDGSTPSLSGRRLPPAGTPVTHARSRRTEPCNGQIGLFLPGYPIGFPLYPLRASQHSVGGPAWGS